MNAIQKAISERDKFLAEHPHMVEYQKQIDDTLNKTPDNMRLEVITLMIAGKMSELQNATMELLNTMK